eukprot:GHUV01017403.1.p1 GENE.GHUV01017403.1~~GHUV01017403.1.p1  ORF type:complete len:180 (+),score=51.21 GHUV01017403.1:487-1026(+)
MPAVISFQLKFWRFLAVWATYSAVTGYLLYLSSGRKMHMSTPRKVYGWFLATYKVSVAVGMTGYILLILDMFGVGLLLAKYVEPGLSLVLLWYGLYFGILGRDLAEVASEQMVSRAGSWGLVSGTTLLVSCRCSWVRSNFLQPLELDSHHPGKKSSVQHMPNPAMACLHAAAQQFVQCQ